jgi:hypothetical protein
MKPGTKLADDYLAANSSVAEQLLDQAGVRLAWRLNEGLQ